MNQIIIGVIMFICSTYNINLNDIQIISQPSIHKEIKYHELYNKSILNSLFITNEYIHDQILIIHKSNSKDNYLITFVHNNINSKAFIIEKLEEKVIIIKINNSDITNKEFVQKKLKEAIGYILFK